jgi:hypothetical protein
MLEWHGLTNWPCHWLLWQRSCCPFAQRGWVHPFRLCSTHPRQRGRETYTVRHMGIRHRVSFVSWIQRISSKVHPHPKLERLFLPQQEHLKSCYMIALVFDWLTLFLLCHMISFSSFAGNSICSSIKISLPWKSWKSNRSCKHFIACVLSTPVSRSRVLLPQVLATLHVYLFMNCYYQNELGQTKSYSPIMTTH